MGLPPLHSENPKNPEIDRAGYSLWHYWAESPRPNDLWSSAKSKLLPDLRHHKSVHGEHPWHRLALRGHLDAMKAWRTSFEHPINKTHDFIGTGEHNDTVFMRAVWSGNTPMIQWLLDMEVDIHTADDNGYTPLMVAIHRCTSEIVQLLLQNGSDPELLDHKGRSAMHHAAQKDHADLYAMVEDCGGNADLADLHGQTAKSILGKSARTPNQAQLSQAHWDMRYHQKLAF